MASKSQLGSHVKVLEGVFGIRAKPHMYLGEQGAQMAFRCVKEEVDNCFDEALAGRNNWIEIFYDYDTGEFIVADKAGGIPVDMKTLESGRKISALTAIFTIPHSGAKFEDDAYKVSSGTHGVGVTAVNAVSAWLKVWTKRGADLYHQSFTEARADFEHPKKVRAIDPAVAKRLVSKGYGTVLHTKLDQNIVSEDAVKGKMKRGGTVAHPDLKQMADWLKLMSNLNPGLTIHLTVRRGGKEKHVELINKDKLDVFLKRHVASLVPPDSEYSTTGKPLVFKTDYVTALFQWSTLPRNELQSSVNNSPTPEGGTHVRGMLDALLEAIAPYENSKHRKGRKRLYSGEDLLVGLIGMFDWRMHGAQYDNQVKTKLVSKIQDEVKAVMLPQFQAFFATNKSLPRAMLTRAMQLENGRLELTKSLGALGDVKRSASGGALPACLNASSTKDTTKRELFLVEGDSAGGTAKNARNPEYQEVFKASGKPSNALNCSLDKLLGNRVIRDLLISFGVNFKEFDDQVKARVPNPTFSVDKLRIARFYLLADADMDGYHINALVMAAIWTLMPDFIKQGRLFIVDAPLYNVIHNGKHYGGATKQECLAKGPSTVKPKDVQRAKGWGEVKVPIMEAIAFDPAVRRVIRVLPFPSADRLSWYRRVVGDDPSARRQLLGLQD